jgi:prepilin-type N-terminal cleavage/methylation domain-containing protein
MRGRRGFTLLEMLVVLAIGGLMVAIVAATFGGTMNRVSVRSAQTEFLTILAQARALAIERGSSMRFEADAATGLVQVEVGCGGAGAALVSRNFREDHGVSMITDGSLLALCMTARGYADPEQNSFAGEGKIAFVRGDRSLSVVLFPLGQAVRE